MGERTEHRVMVLNLTLVEAKSLGESTESSICFPGKKNVSFTLSVDYKVTFDLNKYWAQIIENDI
jgi:hypothetical protein